MYGLAKGIAHLHANNVVHRDISARNTLLGNITKIDENTQIKISDFGFCRVFNWPSDGPQLNSIYNKTGPLKWMAPECAKRQHVFYLHWFHTTCFTSSRKPFI